MPATHSLQPWTYYCLLGLLAITGLSISETLNRRCADIDWSEGVLSIRDTKFRKSRLVPLHVSTLRVLSDYAVRRNHLFASRDRGYFFPSRRGARLDEGQVRRTFYRLSRQIGIRGAVASRGPRLHDFRHRFAVQTLLHLHRGGKDVRLRSPVLLESFFTQRLIAQRRASPHTIGSYRDTFRLLLQFAERRLGKAPSRLTLEDLQAPFLGAFLDNLESARANATRSRNLRLAAIRSFFRYIALE